MLKNIFELQFYCNGSNLPHFPFSLLTSKLEEDFLYMAYADIMAKVTFFFCLLHIFCLNNINEEDQDKLCIKQTEG